MRQKTLFRGLKSKQNFSGGGTAPSPDPSPGGEGDTPSPHPTPLGAFGASILAPSALGVPVLFHLQFEPCLKDSVAYIFSISINHLLRMSFECRAALLI